MVQGPLVTTDGRCQGGPSPWDSEVLHYVGGGVSSKGPGRLGRKEGCRSPGRDGPLRRRVRDGPTGLRRVCPGPPGRRPTVSSATGLVPSCSRIVCRPHYPPGH